MLVINRTCKIAENPKGHRRIDEIGEQDEGAEGGVRASETQIAPEHGCSVDGAARCAGQGTRRGETFAAPADQSTYPALRVPSKKIRRASEVYATLTFYDGKRNVVKKTTTSFPGMAANRDGIDQRTRPLGASDIHQTRQMDVGHDGGTVQDAQEDDEERALLHTLSVSA